MNCIAVRGLGAWGLFCDRPGVLSKIKHRSGSGVRLLKGRRGGFGV
jgi:hypothetical protein